MSQDGENGRSPSGGSPLPTLRESPDGTTTPPMPIGGYQNFRPDHVAIAVGKGYGKAVCALYKEFFGFETSYGPTIRGDERTKMWTAVMRRDAVQFAIMEGIDGWDPELERWVLAQISLYERGKRPGRMMTQHYAIEVDDLPSLVSALFERDIRFITEHDDGRPKILFDKDPSGGAVLQCFTDPVGNGFFLELKQKIGVDEIKNFQEFRDSNVDDLWYYVQKRIDDVGGKEAFFDLTVFRESYHLADSLAARGVTHFEGEDIRKPLPFHRIERNAGGMPYWGA